LQQLGQGIRGQPLSGQIEQQLILTKTEPGKSVLYLQQVAQVQRGFSGAELFQLLPNPVLVQGGSLHLY
jgi:hypothetical protein